ncbi:hypothetical protein Ahy_A03g015030 [Arachis hypogaea]|uniref:Uncharacterized protein n=1 Tax=Arachis hypogaea TaxID=3818 RepID=A0A445DZ98_ARAHY|nr:hypothetical protein Ahy_A03g015030 [Arachis hypogaea]
MKGKCCLWVTYVKTYGDGGTNEYELVCTLDSQQPLLLQNIRRFEEEIYCLSPTIVNMAIGNHEGGEILQPKTKKPFKIEDYKIFILFLDQKKLASHPYGYVISKMRAEVDHFRAEYVSRILFHEMNRDKDTATRESEAIRLSKPSAVLLSPYCQIDSDDIDSD